MHPQAAIAKVQEKEGHSHLEVGAGQPTLDQLAVVPQDVDQLDFDPTWELWQLRSTQ